MTLLNKLILILSCLLLGCAKPDVKPVIVTEYIEVKVPVRYKLDKPNRPSYLKTDNVPIYLTKLLKYTKQLEIIIDENNKDL